MDDSRETRRRAFVAGHPIGHSRSPLIHGYWLEQLKIDGTYRALDVSPDAFPTFIADLKSGTSGWVGGNVTIPHKETAFRLADEPDRLAEELGAANTLWLEEGVLKATNTDGAGFTANLDHHHPGWEKTESAVILGAGGASRAVIQSIRDRGVRRIYVVNRTLERAKELADRFGATVEAYPLPALNEAMTGAGLFVNTTSLGMEGGGETMEIDFSRLAQGALVTDIVYVPLKTPMLVQAERQGVKTVDGLGMLLHQAVPGFEKWFGVRPHVDAALRQRIVEDMERH